MTRYRYKDWFRQAWHPSQENLLQYSDGEMQAKEAARVREHLDGCWSCRAQREELEQSILRFVEYRKNTLQPSSSTLPQARLQFRAKLSRLAAESTQPSFLSRLLLLSKDQSFFPSAARLVVCVVLSCFIGLSWLWLSKVPPVSAKEVLRRVEKAESSRIRQVASPVIYQKLQVRRRTPAPRNDDAVTWEIWNDAGHNRFRRRVADKLGARFIEAGHHSERAGNGLASAVSVPPVLAELDQIFEANGMDIRRPLSSTGYQGWRDRFRQRSEQVVETELPDGSKGLQLTTSVAGSHAANAITRCELVVRAHDWHPVEQRVWAQGASGPRDYELAELAYDVVTLNALAPSIFASTTPSISSVSVPPEQSASLVLPPTGADLLVAEIETRYALHRLKACLGEPIEVLRDPLGRIEVKGLAPASERKTELLAALRTIPLVTARILTIREAERMESRRGRLAALDKDDAQQSDQQTLEVKTRLPIQSQLERYFSKRDPAAEPAEAEPRNYGVPIRIAGLANEALSLSEAALSEAWALRHLARDYPQEKTKTLSPSGKRLFETMVKDHTDGLRQQLSALRV
ncbi:MAG: zf-HC2 domain-containing protein, partial [Acidobacteria bacterium]|nr:zf-HC2 domain-containing protein [Acidobacteriota bacterium]